MITNRERLIDEAVRIALRGTFSGRMFLEWLGRRHYNQQRLALERMPVLVCNIRNNFAYLTRSAA